MRRYGYKDDELTHWGAYCVDCNAGSSTRDTACMCGHTLTPDELLLPAGDDDPVTCERCIELNDHWDHCPGCGEELS